MKVIKCKKASKMLGVNYADLLDIVKAVLITQQEVRRDGLCFRLLGEKRNEQIVKGEVHVFTTNGIQIVLSDAKRCTDAYGSMVLLEGKLVW